MSIFPTGAVTSEPRTAMADRDTRIETDGVLVQPINGQIYLIEEQDLEWLSSDQGPSALSRLISRH